VGAPRHNDLSSAPGIARDKEPHFRRSEISEAINVLPGVRRCNVLAAVAIIFWIVGHLLAFTLRGVIHLVTEITGLSFQRMMQVFNNRT
jgi:hypothetical protein